MAVEVPAAQRALLRAAVALAARAEYRHFVVVSDLPSVTALIPPRSRAWRKLVLAVSTAAQREAMAGLDREPLVVPAYAMSRMERVRLALVAGLERGALHVGDTVLALAGVRPAAFPDSLMVEAVAGSAAEGALVGPVAEAVLGLALEVGAEGWEGHGVGALFVVGDAARVMERSRQLSLNPYQGYAEAERNVLDPTVRESLRAFATLDGAFVIRADGVVLAAGRYLTFARDVAVPLGLGARHMAAAGITADTDAVAISVSQTSGAVRVFRGGHNVLELSPARRRV